MPLPQPKSKISIFLLIIFFASLIKKDVVAVGLKTLEGIYNLIFSPSILIVFTFCHNFYRIYKHISKNNFLTMSMNF